MIWINEECDLLWANEACCANSTEAAAFVPFDGVINLGTVSNAKLITVAPHASDGGDRNRLYFNGGEWHGIWDGFAGCTNLSINETDVRSYLSPDDNLARFQSHIPVGETEGDYMEVTNAILVVEMGEAIPSAFDTGPGTYPSIRGTHKGTIMPSHTIYVTKMYTYPCFKTDGHSEYVRIYNETGTIVESTWIGTYLGDYQWITFDTPFTLYKEVTYNYTIVTGCYPQIIHKQNHTTLDSSFITCTEFTDANGRTYDNWIPAIRLE